MRAFVMLSTIVTSGNLVAGWLAVLLATQGRFPETALLVILAVGLDSLDGPLARRGTREDAFGANLDSLADLVSFGVVPALALYLSTLHTLSIIGVAGCLAFLLCGAWRLARFPLVYSPDFFVGLPIPPAGLLAALLAASEPPPVLALLTVLLLGTLMVSELPFPKPSATPRHLRRLLHKQPS